MPVRKHPHSDLAPRRVLVLGFARKEPMTTNVEDLGLGACWLGVHPREQRIRALKEILALPASVIPVACISIGYPAESLGPRTRFNPQYMHFERW